MITDLTEIFQISLMFLAILVAFGVEGAIILEQKAKIIALEAVVSAVNSNTDNVSTLVTEANTLVSNLSSLLNAIITATGLG